MSDDLMREETDRRAHRCQPPRGKIGKLWQCACGVTFQYVESRVGAQWLPADSSQK